MILLLYYPPYFINYFTNVLGETPSKSVHLEDSDKVRLLAIAGVDASDTEIHTQLFGEPCLGDDSLLQMLLDKVTILFLLFH